MKHTILTLFAIKIICKPYHVMESSLLTMSYKEGLSITMGEEAALPP